MNRFRIVFLVALCLAALAMMASGRAPEDLLCPGPEPAPITDMGVYQTPAMAEPVARAPFRDPVFGRCVTRLTDRNADIAQGDASQGLQNEYSRVQSFNADESLILIRGTEATWYLYRAATLQPLGALPIQGAVDPRWDASDPSLLYTIDGTRLMLLLVQTGETAVQHDFASDLHGIPATIVWTRYEGSPSADGRWWGFMAQNDAGNTLAFLIYDQRADAVTALRDVRNVPGADAVDSATISPLGDYFVAQFGTCPEGTLGTDAHPCGLMVYDAQLQNGRGLVRNIGHSDFALDADEREVMVYQQNDTDHLSVVDLATGVNTDLWPIDFSHTGMGFHFSGRAFRKPGWALVSTHDGDPASYTWMDDELFAMELKAGGRVVRLAHTHSIVNQGVPKDYFAEPQASANRDFTRLLFTTNWGRTGTEQVETYLVELEPGWDGSCSLSCAANVPALAKAGDALTFQGASTSTNCQGATSYSWDFGDGSAVSSEQAPSHAYVATGTYAWSFKASADQSSCARSGQVQVSTSGTCALGCLASAPALAVAGQTAAFTGIAAAQGCSGGASWDWDFGDGSAHDSEASPIHVYAQGSSYTWKATASADGLACTKSGTLAVAPPAPPPALSSVTKRGAPFRLTVGGSNFQDGLKVFIADDAEPWTNRTRVNDSRVLLKGGGSLKARFPKGQAVAIRVVNPDGQSAQANFTR